MANGDGKNEAARRGAKLRKVLVAGGVALAAACAGMHKESSGKGSSDSGTSSSGSSNTSGDAGGASGW